VIKALALAAALTLGGCASISGVAVPSQSTQVVIADGSLGIDTTYNAVAKAYMGVAPSLTAAQKAPIKALFAKLLTCPSSGPCTGFIAAADSAAALGESATLEAQINNATVLIGQIQGLLPVSAK
jgi:uncharacterized protein YceK